MGAFDVWRVFGESRYRCMRTRWMEEKKKKNELKNIFYISFLIPRLYLPDNNNERSTKIFLMFLAKSNRLRITKKFKTLVVLCLR